MLYAAKCYWPDATEDELEQIAACAAQARSRPAPNSVAHVGSLLFGDDDLVLCLFEGPPAPRRSKRWNWPAFHANG